MSQEPLAIRVELTYQCLRIADLVLRDAQISAFGASRSGGIAIYDRHDASGIPAAWRQQSTVLTAWAKLRFSAPMARFWALAPRAVTGLKPFFPRSGLEVKLAATWLWDGPGHEQCEGMTLRVTEANAGAPERVFLTATGMASPFVLRRRIQLARGDIIVDAPDTTTWRAHRTRLETRFGPDAIAVLEAFE